MLLTQDLNLHASLSWLGQAADVSYWVSAATIYSLKRYDGVLSSVLY